MTMSKERRAILMTIDKICENKGKEGRPPYASPKEVNSFLEAKSYASIKVLIHRLHKEGFLHKPKSFRGLYRLTEEGVKIMLDSKASAK